MSEGGCPCLVHLNVHSFPQVMCVTGRNVAKIFVGLPWLRTPRVMLQRDEPSFKSGAAWSRSKQTKHLLNACLIVALAHLLAYYPEKHFDHLIACMGNYSAALVESMRHSYDTESSIHLHLTLQRYSIPPR